MRNVVDVERIGVYFGSRSGAAARRRTATCGRHSGGGATTARRRRGGAAETRRGAVFDGARVAPGRGINLI